MSASTTAQPQPGAGVKATADKAAGLPPLSLLYKLGRVRPGPPCLPAAILTLVEPNAELNDRISLVRGDITRLKVDAIVNAANS